MKKKLIQTLKNFDYRYNRYKVDYSVTMWHCPANVDFSTLTHCIRKTDQLVCLDARTYAVIFDYSTPESNIQALNHLLEHYKCTYSSNPICSAVFSASQFESLHEMVPQLLHQLDQSIEKSPFAISSKSC